MSYSFTPLYSFNIGINRLPISCIIRYTFVFVYGKSLDGYFYNISSGSTLFVMVKKDFQTKNTILLLKNVTYHPSFLDMTMDYPMFIASNQKEECIMFKG